MKTIFIRADANKSIASGHIMRTKAIADALQALGAKVVFITADDKAKELLTGYENIILNSAYDKMDSEIDAFAKILKEHKNSAVLLDSYFITPLYLNAISKLAKIAYIDDINTFAYEVDLLINYSAFLDFNAYKKAQNKAKAYLLGASYTPLREQFSSVNTNKSYEIKKVLITTGGADILNLAYNLLKSITKDNELLSLEYEIVIGAYNEHKERILELASKYPNLRTRQNVKDMASLMRGCDAAISAGGSTLYELSALSIPSICTQTASNQKDAPKWGQSGAMLYAGDASKDLASTIKSALNHLKTLLHSPTLAQNLATKAHNLVDGKGASKIAKELIKL